MSFLLTVVIAALGLSALNPIFAVTPGFPYGSQKVRGVNLGGWLVLEVNFFILYPVSSPHGHCLAMDHPFFVR
jgi:hypothetical protein